MSNSSQPIEIPNRFDFVGASDRIYLDWIEAGCFDADVDLSKKPFTIVIPPPNVTGALHLGHALNNTLQDIQIRMHRMMGEVALWMPGTDHAGIATQAVVEKRLKELENKTRHDLGRDALIQRIWDWKEQYEGRILSQLKRLGCSCDWRRTRFTLDPMCARAVRRTFYDLFSKGLIYRGKRLVNWDTYLQTAVSDDEVTTETVEGNFWHFRYPVIDPKPGEPKFVVVATTRPETMLGDTAVAVHPDPAGALAKSIALAEQKLAEAPAKDKELIASQIDLLKQRQEQLLPSLEKLAAMARDGRKIRLPLIDREIPLVVDTWAKPDLGSGCVKITPAHDPNDYEVAQRCGLPMINIMNTDGTINSNGGRFQGLMMGKARQQVVQAIEELGLLEQTEDRQIELKHSDRSKTPIEPYLADQWFVAMAELAQSAIDAVESGKVKIYPERYGQGYVDWLSEKRDWPVGRQLWWGHQIPIWTRGYETVQEAKDAKAKILAMPEALAGQMSASIEEPAVLHVCIEDENPGLELKVQSLGLVRQEDVLDTWFSSALWPHSTLGWPEKTAELDYFYPTSTLITSRDIITLWVARMVLMGLNNVGEVPFREVYIHPKILDGFGETMSKSKGNGVDPIDVIDKFGADALRFGLAWLTTETQDVRMPVQYECPHCQSLINQTKENRIKHRVVCDKCKKPFSTQWAESAEDKALPKAPVVSERFEVARNFVNKLWNASRFVMMNLEGYNQVEIDWSNLPLEDQWILSRLMTTTEIIDRELRRFGYAEAARAAYDFAWDDFCSFYVEMAKPRMQDPVARPMVQRVLAYCLDQMLRILHPMMPFVTEAIWQELAKFTLHRDLYSNQQSSKWLIQAAWPVARKELIRQDVESQFKHFVALIGAIREIRSRQNIAPKQRVQFSVRCEDRFERLLRPMGTFLESMAGADGIAWGPSIGIPEVHAHVPIEGMDVYVDLSQFLDVGAEILRNEKQLENLQKLITGKESRLSNQAFVGKAPAEIIDKERQALADLVAQRQGVEQALVKLRAMK
ncbi:MAG: valine--tRNA ligase [Planctomycetota bacterium]|jgi:valyl-tRNA synthetase